MASPQGVQDLIGYLLGPRCTHGGGAGDSAPPPLFGANVALVVAGTGLDSELARRRWHSVRCLNGDESGGPCPLPGPGETVVLGGLPDSCVPLSNGPPRCFVPIGL